MSGRYSAGSQLLSKQAELKKARADYENYRKIYTPYTTRDSLAAAGVSGWTAAGSNTNPMSGTNVPPGISPGDDYGEYWKAVKNSDGTTPPTTTVAACNIAASNDPRLFRKVVYTNPPGNPLWTNKCYGLMYYAPTDAEQSGTLNGVTTSTPPTSYGTSGTNTYSKQNIKSDADTANASKMYDLKTKIDRLANEIAILAPKAIDLGRANLMKDADKAKDVSSKITDYMDDGVLEIARQKKYMDETQKTIMVYDETNSQIMLKAVKSRFFISAFIGIAIILAYFSYMSELTLVQQFNIFLEFFSGYWWTKWSVIVFVIVLLLLSSFGWDMRGNLTTIFRYVSDPKFWVGELWWIGITLFLFVIVFFYSSFSSFFTAKPSTS